jgi:Arc/MetJ-type ribon-helix-helix transcriptional regulator
MAIESTRKVTLTLPSSLLIRLDAAVPSRKRSRFIAEAIEERLAITEQLAALEETAGAWSDERHPDMRSDADIDRWLANLRAAWSSRGSEQHG